MAHSETFPRSLGPWQFSANGIAGQLTLTDNGSGNLSGSIDEDQVIGFWDANAQKVTFLRIANLAADPSSVQVYTGYLSSHILPPDEIAYTLVGSYQAFSGADVTAQRNVFGWSASTSRPVS